MADYYEQTVVQQTIPDEDMTPLERLLLSHIFSCEPDGDGWYFYAEESPSTTIFLTRKELEDALATSADPESAAHGWATEQLADLDANDCDAEIDFDLSDISWEFFLQDIVKRSKSLRYISVVAAFTCSRMRTDGFGGAATLITRDAILGKSNSTLIDDFLAEAGLDRPDMPGADAALTPSDGGAAP
ncbi:hypothetical protein [Halodurantibacterium flavum]|uniref:DUF4303 domain-containing protein n=1 Tax=Halodurantibacterium flavum TaxID=1382802 RepID=A0ABW4S2I2_9RHOB